MTPREVLALCREKDVKAVDLRFTDLWGDWRSVTLPVGRLDEAVFEDGVAIDGSSVPGWQPPHASDLVLLPDPQTAFLDPFPPVPTLAMIGSVYDPLAGEPYSRDPRYIAQKAATYLQRTGVADRLCCGPELHFYVFEAARYAQTAESALVELTPLAPNTGRAAPQSGSVATWGGLAGASGGLEPLRELQTDLMQALVACGLSVESHHQEPAGRGQGACALSYGTPVAVADAVQIAKYCIRSVARRQGKVATLMPQPLAGEPGNALRMHLSLWRGPQPLFAGTGYAGLSELGLYAVGGLLRHAPALCGLVCATTNSYRRLARRPGDCAVLAYAQRSRAVACRVPLSPASPDGRRIEFRLPDPLCNPYLALAAVTMAVLDGIQVKLSCGPPLEQDPGDLAPAQRQQLRWAPATLEEALGALEQDSQFLQRDDVFTPDVLETWIGHKREHETAALRTCPHPWEFCQYFER
jgi:glutamine synthetase